MSDLYTIGAHPDGVRAICKECERVVLKDDSEEAKDVVDNHNDNMHDGDDVAGLCAWDVVGEEIDVDIDSVRRKKAVFEVAREMGRMDE